MIIFVRNFRSDKLYALAMKSVRVRTYTNILPDTTYFVKMGNPLFKCFAIPRRIHKPEIDSSISPAIRISKQFRMYSFMDPGIVKRSRHLNFYYGDIPFFQVTLCIDTRFPQRGKRRFVIPS
jgi:hypothetical protein